jgi:hypothetical protein
MNSKYALTRLAGNPIFIEDIKETYKLQETTALPECVLQKRQDRAMTIPEGIYRRGAMLTDGYKNQISKFDTSTHDLPPTVFMKVQGCTEPTTDLHLCN